MPAHLTSARCGGFAAHLHLMAAEDSNDQYGRDIDSWLERVGGPLIGLLAIGLVIWGALVVFG